MSKGRAPAAEAGRAHIAEYGGRFDRWQRQRGEDADFHESVLAIERQAAAIGGAAIGLLRFALAATTRNLHEIRASGEGHTADGDFEHCPSDVCRENAILLDPSHPGNIVMTSDA
jgi:hypothetical protein